MTPNTHNEEKDMKELRGLLEELERNAAIPDTSPVSGEWSLSPVDVDMPLILNFDDMEEDVPDDEIATLPDVVTTVVPPRRNPFVALGQWVLSLFPKKADTTPQRVRKLAFLLAVVVFISSTGYLLYDMVIQPYMSQNLYEQAVTDYHPEDTQLVPEGSVYPAGMLSGFTSLYDQNPEVRGWLTFRATSQKDFLHIDYPIVYSGDNDKYLKIDFYGNRNRNGALFFDQNNHIESDNHTNQSLIVYGHNLSNGQMFTGLNRLIGNVNNARAAATFSLSTIFEPGEYKVFAVLLTDEEAKSEHYFNTRRTTFPSDESFLDFVEKVRARSLFDYPVDVLPGDQLAILSTCSSRSASKLQEGRTTVIARRVREGEGTAVSVNEIVKNEDVIMPWAWYKARDLAPHTYYTNGELPQGPTVTTTTTVDMWSTLPTYLYPSYTMESSTSTTTTMSTVYSTTLPGSTTSTTTTVGTTKTTATTKATTKTTKTTKTTTTTKPTKPTKSTDTTKATDATTQSTTDTTKATDATTTETTTTTTGTEE